MRWILLAAMLLVGIPARAESPAEREAREHYTLGQKLFDQARYADALAEFQQSYALSKYPALIYKMALCQDQLGRSAEAVESYESYLKADPQTSRRAGVEERIVKLRETLHPSAAWPPGGAAKEPTSSQPLSSSSATSSPAAQQPQSSSSSSSAEVSKPASKSTPAYKKWWLWTVVGVVAVGAAVGIGVGVTASQQSSFSPTLPPIGPAALRF
jgi:tetratricopeptide (TPR) repeat protein